MARITYENERTIEENDPALTLLEISLKNGVPHMHACGGHARCSTCRVLVSAGAENLVPRGEAEETLALKRGFESSVRLACQTRVRGPVTIRRLVLDNRDYEAVRERSQSTTGREDNLAILFSDIRNFTGFSEKHLPYDIIHILNRYFETMGEIVLRNGGMLDKYIGDGLMANFGLKQSDPVAICLLAVNAALEMLAALNSVNEYARQHLDHEFRIGIGIHFGNVIVGELGHHSNAAFTIIGDAVNTAARLESMTKKAGARLLVSDAVYERVRPHVTRGRVFRAPLKGKTGEFRLYEILEIDREIVRRTLVRGATPAFREARLAARDTYMLVFEKPGSFAFKAGQFVDLTLPARPGERPLSHSFSLASAPEETELRFITRNTKSAFKQALLDLRAGETVHISEPTGTLLKLPEPRRTHVFLAGGIGVTPFYSIIRHEIDSNASGELLLFAANRDPDSMIYHEEFMRLEREFAGFQYIPTLTKNVPEEWPAFFERGRIDVAMILRHVPSLSAAVYYIAGAVDFTVSLRETLERQGVAPSNILMESFYGY